MKSRSWSVLPRVRSRLVLLCLAVLFVGSRLNSGPADVQAKEQGSSANAAAGDAKKPGAEGAKPASDTQATSLQKSADNNPSAQEKKTSPPTITLVESDDQIVWDLMEGQSQAFSLQITTDAAAGVNVGQIAFALTDPKSAPAESKLVRVTGPAGGFPVALKQGEKMIVTLNFPPHRSTGEYAASLTYTTKEAPDQQIGFHAATVRVGMMWKWLAAVIAGFFCLVITLLTFLVSKVGNKPLNFFQSPDGGYSVSKFQIWIWTLVIVFSYSYLFLWQGKKLELSPNVWALLGISVASTGIAKVIAVKQAENKGGDVAPQPDTPTPASANPPAPAPPAAAAAAAGIVKALKVAPRPNWLTSMLSDSDQLSLMRIQMFAWTMVTAAMYMVYLFQQQALWEVPAGLLVLMGISHSGYLVDKGATPRTDMQCESIQPNSIKADATTKKNSQTSLVILGQNFKPDVVKCFVGGIALSPTAMTANRIEAPLPAGSLDGGKKYDVVVQQPGENSEVKAGAFEVTI